MDFPTWVPAVVQSHVESQIEGDHKTRLGWAKILAGAEIRLSEIDTIIKKFAQSGEIQHLNSLIIHRTAALNHRDLAEETLNCFQRLSTDVRMRDAYRLLSVEFTEKLQWCGLIDSACFALTNYKHYRERLAKTKTLRDKITVSATELAKHLREAYDIFASDWPLEFFDVRELLQQTDNHEIDDRYLAIWRSVRQCIIGDLPKLDIPIFGNAQRQANSEEVTNWGVYSGESNETQETVKVEQARENPWHAWQAAPPLSALLETVAKAAKKYEPEPAGWVASAIGSRKKNSKAEYLRSFAYLLFEEHSWRAKPYFIATTPAVIKAMAIVANVAINQTNTDVSPDDVRKVLRTKKSQTLNG